MIVTDHAVDRWRERIDPRATPAEATAAIQQSRAAVDLAARFGCPVVRTGRGAKLVLRGDVVVTVIPRDWICHRDPLERAYLTADSVEPAARLA